MDQPFVVNDDVPIADVGLEAPAANDGVATVPKHFVAAPTAATVTSHPAVVRAFDIFHVKLSARRIIKVGGDVNLAMSRMQCVQKMAVSDRLNVARGVLDDLIGELEDEDDVKFPDMTTCHGDYIYIIIGLWYSATEDDSETTGDRKARVTSKLEELTEDNLARVRVSVRHHAPTGIDEAAERAAGTQRAKDAATKEAAAKTKEAAAAIPPDKFPEAADTVGAMRALLAAEFARRDADDTRRRAEERAREEEDRRRRAEDEDRRRTEEDDRRRRAEDDDRRRREHQPFDQQEQLRQLLEQFGRDAPADERADRPGNMNLEHLQRFAQGIELQDAPTDSDDETSCTKSMARRLAKTKRLINNESRRFQYACFAETMDRKDLVTAWDNDLRDMKLKGGAQTKFDDEPRLDEARKAIEIAFKAMVRGRSTPAPTRRLLQKNYQQQVEIYWYVKLQVLHPDNRALVRRNFDARMADTLKVERSKWDKMLDYDRFYADVCKDVAAADKKDPNQRREVHRGRQSQGAGRDNTPGRRNNDRRRDYDRRDQSRGRDQGHGTASRPSTPDPQRPPQPQWDSAAKEWRLPK